MPGVIVPTPEISSFKIDSEIDFLVLGCKTYYFCLLKQKI